MIKRDGECISLWQDSVPEFHSSKQVSKEDHYDVIIAGGGITGITTGLLLQEAGKKCLILEAKNICFGTTGGTTAHLNTLLDTPYTEIEKKFSEEVSLQVAQSASDAIELIRKNIAKNDISCEFEEAKAYLYATNEKQVKELDEIYAALTRAGLAANYADQIPVPDVMLKAISVPGQAKFNPLRYVYGLAKAFEDTGGVIQENCCVTHVEKNEGLLEVESSLGTFRCTNLVYATHIPPGVNLLHLRCVPYRSYAMAIELADHNYPPDLTYDMVDPYHYYRTQLIDGKKFLIAGGKDHGTGQEDGTTKFDELESHIKSLFSIKDIPYKWSSQYFEPADGIPYIGLLPGHKEQIYVATGFGGNGMIYSHVAAMILTGMITDRPLPNSTLFNPARVKPVAGFKNFISHNAKVAGELVSKLFSGTKMKEWDEIAVGEAKIVKHDHQKLAVYRDEAGELHAVDAVCSHLGCEVKWNGVEKSWDCPCHGARYSVNGDMLTGPADTGLDRLELKEEQHDTTNQFPY